MGPFAERLGREECRPAPAVVGLQTQAATTETVRRQPGILGSSSRRMVEVEPFPDHRFLSLAKTRPLMKSTRCGHAEISLFCRDEDAKPATVNIMISSKIFMPKTF